MPHTGNNKVDNRELMEAIKRSGYLLESKISEMLSKADFFVDSNQVVRDQLTGKSREIDLIAEYYPYADERHKNIFAKIKFVFEIKNNPYPMVLMTSFKWSPNVILRELIREVITDPLYVFHTMNDGFYGKLFESKNSEAGIYTQYCTFKKKKEGGHSADLMAWHPDEFHEGLVKITQYCDEAVEPWNDHRTDRYFRDFLFLPVLVLGGDLYELRIDKRNRTKLNKVLLSKLIYNYHRRDEPKSAIIYVVTKRGLLEFVKNMIKIERSIENHMSEEANALKTSQEEAN